MRELGRKYRSHCRSSYRTCFIVAHRLSAIRFADKILVTGDKGIIEQGSHEELLRMNGRYREMIQTRYG